MSAVPPVDELRIDTSVVGNSAHTLIFINDVDLLELQRPDHRPDGSPYPSGPKTFLPADPVDVLPPDTRVLLPFHLPTEAMVGVCSCGEPGCGSLWLQVRRDGQTVLWEPDPLTVRSSIDATYRFELTGYLDAVDGGYRSSQPWETRPRRLARELRRRRDSLFGFSMGSTRQGTAADLTWARAWPGVEHISISGVGEQRWFYEVLVPDDLSDEDIIAGIQRLDPNIVRSPF